jgi:nitrite reductase/ring-hydroxylating ferredoxin subunit
LNGSGVQSLDMDASEGRRVADLEEVPAEGTLLFTVRGDSDLEEVVLVRLDGEVAAWKNYCMHWTDVRLDKGEGAMVRNGELVCQKHAATFEADSGYCNFGPCEGAMLDAVEVAIDEGGIYLTDEDYEFAHRGPSGEERADGTAGGRIDFTGA